MSVKILSIVIVVPTFLIQHFDLNGVFFIIEYIFLVLDLQISEIRWWKQVVFLFCDFSSFLIQVLLQVADDFIENVVASSCQLAKHRRSNTLEAKDVQLYLGNT